MKLEVNVRISPQSKEITPAEMDRLLDSELIGFEKWFVARQRVHNRNASGLISAERGVLKAYLIYCATERQADT